MKIKFSTIKWLFVLDIVSIVQTRTLFANGLTLSKKCVLEVRSRLDSIGIDALVMDL